VQVHLLTMKFPTLGNLWAALTDAFHPLFNHKYSDPHPALKKLRAGTKLTQLASYDGNANNGKNVTVQRTTPNEGRAFAAGSKGGS